MGLFGAGTATEALVGKRFTARGLNGAVSAIVAVFFLVHGALGALAALTGFSSPFAWAVWVGVALIGVHVVVSVVTSAEQLGDAERPPSARKKRHLALKWATGALLAVCAGAHVLVPLGRAVSSWIIVGVSIALAAHVCVGARSLLKDLGIDRRHKTAVRVVVVAFAAVFALAMLAGAFR